METTVFQNEVTNKEGEDDINGSKMTGSSLVEDPGIPLVDRRNGKYNKYMADDNTSQTDLVSNLAPVSKFDNISYRLSRRKKLIKRRRYVVSVEFTLALLGIVFMLVETELFIQKVVTKTDAISLILKTCISISTVFLLMAIIAYHITGIQLHMTDNSLEDWRLAVSFPWTYLKIFTELIICAIHPFPSSIEIPGLNPDGKTKMVSIDPILSILMLLRLYLVGKFMVVNSRLLTDTATQSLGALNKVKINTAFVFKALMSSNPGTVLVSIMLAILIVDTWAMRTCEVYYHPDEAHSSFFNAMWMIAITFLTVGYGDIYPNTYCGRFVAVATGLMGVGTTALLVAVLASKLEQSRAEKYVHNFVSRAQLDKQRKHAAADTIKYVIQLWRLRRQDANDDRKRIRLHGKLLQAIANMREAKNEKACIGESAIGFIEVAKSINEVNDTVEGIQETQKDMQTKINDMESKMDDLANKMDAVYHAIAHR
ncbi:small conductance calcium-activated potassium channel protein 2-like isoform X1 [Argopecten irradians]|uniref:small conductance calcium-activated potassium channel protein 2-like isoform X1 n=2 Tax=Argopecten irradians TaxID=31199 RepID=UPI003712BAC7